MKPEIIALTGGIGSGKSVVAKILRSWGYKVFDCDSEAKVLMDNDSQIKARLALEIADEVVRNGCIDRGKLAAIVFSDEQKLKVLNSIVHHRVRERLGEWASHHSDKPVVFVETAILYSSGLFEDVDAELRVDAPVELRIERVMARNGISRRQVEDRIESQRKELEPAKPLSRISTIINDNNTPILPQLHNFLNTQP